MEIAAVMAVASAGLKAVGSIREGEAAASAANTQADWAAENARIARQNAERARTEGYAQEDILRRSQRLDRGRNAAAQAQSGIDGGSGSALMVAEQSAAAMELDALTTRYQGLMRGVDNERKAIALDREVAIGRAQAKASRQAGVWGAVTGVLGSAASYYGGQSPRGGYGS